MPRELVYRVDSAPEFHQAVERVAEPASVESAITALTEGGARLYLANAAHSPLVLLHTVTAPAALRLMLPHLPAALHRTALAYVWQAIAATSAAYAEASEGRPEAGAGESLPSIIEQSVETNDPHAIKFAEACAREFRLNRNPIYLAAARDWAERLHRAKSWSDAERAASGIAIADFSRRSIAFNP
jgi:hypothetical protein